MTECDYCGSEALAYDLQSDRGQVSRCIPCLAIERGQQQFSMPFELREMLGDTWGEKVLVKLLDGEPVEHYAAVPGKSHIREAWPEAFDEPVWMHVNEVGYRLRDYEGRFTWEIVDWEDAPVSAKWVVVYP